MIPSPATAAAQTASILVQTTDGEVAPTLNSPLAGRQSCSTSVLLEPSGLQVEPLITMNENQAAEAGLGGATGALAVGESIWVGSFTGERIGVFSRSVRG